MRITVALKKLPELLRDLNICMVDPVTLKFAYVDGKRGEVQIDLTDDQTARLRRQIENTELQRRYAK